jgi:hypothetical protein
MGITAIPASRMTKGNTLLPADHAAVDPGGLPGDGVAGSVGAVRKKGIIDSC